MKKMIALLLLVCYNNNVLCWGFYAHKQINYYAVWLLPPEMLVLYKPNVRFLSDHAVDPDKRRYIVAGEGPRHFIDIDHYGEYPFDSLPRFWNEAVAKYGFDTLSAHGIVPWWIQTTLWRLTDAFKKKDVVRILKLSADIGHYLGDAHVPLHTSSNHNGQLTNQHGIHGFWESRVPELLAADNWDFFIGCAVYIDRPSSFIWDRVLESAAAADSVLAFERKLTLRFPPDQKFSYEERNGVLIRQFSTAYCEAYNKILDNMVERRMRQSIFAVASFWYTAWVNAGQPNLKEMAKRKFTEEELKEFEELNSEWMKGKVKGRECE